MRSNLRFQPTVDSMPVRITPSDLLMAPVVVSPTPTPTSSNPMAPVVIKTTTISSITYSDM